jgi:hypothetical protein
VRIISTSPLSHVVTELGEMNPGSPGPGYYTDPGGRDLRSTHASTRDYGCQ